MDPSGRPKGWITDFGMNDNGYDMYHFGERSTENTVARAFQFHPPSDPVLDHIDEGTPMELTDAYESVHEQVKLVSLKHYHTPGCKLVIISLKESMSWSSAATGQLRCGHPNENLGRFLSYVLRHAKDRDNRLPRDAGGWFVIQDLMRQFYGEEFVRQTLGGVSATRAADEVMDARARYFSEFLSTVRWDRKG